MHLCNLNTWIFSNETRVEVPNVGLNLYCLQDDLNPELALLPFKPIAMKVLQCAFPSGIEWVSLSSTCIIQCEH